MNMTFQLYMKSLPAKRWIRAIFSKLDVTAGVRPVISGFFGTVIGFCRWECKQEQGN